jgi:hypothetical protein
MYTLYDDKEIVFVNRVVMNALVGRGIASSQTEAWNIMRKALKTCLDQQPVPVKRAPGQVKLGDFVERKNAPS